MNAECLVINHLPTCSCNPQFTGDPFTYCRIITRGIFNYFAFIYCVDKNHYKFCFFYQEPVVSTQPCSPSPCGPNSQCREINGQAVCSCLTGFLGQPPGCRPECTINSECGSTKACINRKCTDPCLGTCGLGARCETVNHSPICSCPAKFTGDPFVNCFPSPSKSILDVM